MHFIPSLLFCCISVVLLFLLNAYCSVDMHFICIVLFCCNSDMTYFFHLDAYSSSRYIYAFYTLSGLAVFRLCFYFLFCWVHIVSQVEMYAFNPLAWPWLVEFSLILSFVSRILLSPFEFGVIIYVFVYFIYIWSVVHFHSLLYHKFWYVFSFLFE